MTTYLYSLADAMTAEAGIVALHEKTRCSISPYCAEVLVERLQCDDEEDDITNEDDCV